MKTMMRGLAFCAIALAACCATAGTVEQAKLFADPQMQVKDGAVQGCGYRIKGLVNFSPASNSMIALDISFNVYSSGLALMKGGAAEFTMKIGQANPSGPFVRPVETFWMKSPDISPTRAVDGRITPGENKGYVLYLADLDAVMKLFDAVWDRKPLTMGARIKGESMDRIYTGVVETSDADAQQMQQCIVEMAQQMRREAQGNKPQ